MGSHRHHRRSPGGRRPSRHRACFVVPALAALAALTVALSGQAPAAWPPPTLRDTGLYSDWAARIVTPDNLPFSPQYPLWSDGAQKSRWLHIPKGTFIDGSNPDVWVFPVGMRVWKEFRFGRRAETRLIERTGTGWQYATYAWNEDETEATLVPAGGMRYSVPIRDGVRHGIPSRADCRACHEGGPARLLGVTALQLSPDRDPNAPHAEPLPPGAIDLTTLVSRGLLRGTPAQILNPPPRVVAASPAERAALGYLNSNCGSCHIATGELRSLAFALNYPLNRPPGEPAPALATSIGRPSRFKVPDADDVRERIARGDPERSVVVVRMATRNPLVQMPPLGTRIVDDQAVDLLRRWIAEITGLRRPVHNTGGKGP
jgi:mono/diheme cytochrome c family protein